jgi:hypothetical protein
MDDFIEKTKFLKRHGPGLIAHRSGGARQEKNSRPGVPICTGRRGGLRLAARVSSASPFLRSLASLGWPLFLACSVLLAVVWIGGVGEGSFAGIANADLRAALAWSARGIDVLWLALAAAAAYFALVRTEGLAVARRWATLVLGVSFLLAVASVLTRWPLGAVFFPENLGWKLGPVPLGWPLLWLVVVVGAREAVLRWRPRAAHHTVALLAGVLCLATAVNLDPLAWKFRVWWLWHPADLAAPAHPPLRSFAVWLLGGAALAWAMRSPHLVPRVRSRPWPPLLALLLLNAVALLTHLARALR